MLYPGGLSGEWVVKEAGNSHEITEASHNCYGNPVMTGVLSNTETVCDAKGSEGKKRGKRRQFRYTLKAFFCMRYDSHTTSKKAYSAVPSIVSGLNCSRVKSSPACHGLKL